MLEKPLKEHQGRGADRLPRPGLRQMCLKNKLLNAKWHVIIAYSMVRCEP